MIIVSLDMFLNNTQDTFVKHKNDKFCLIKGNKNSGKTISTIFKTLYLKRNYCFECDDKILYLTSKLEHNNIVNIFNYINRSDLYKSIIPSENIDVHILTYEDFDYFNMDNLYTHIIVDNIELIAKAQLEKIFSKFKNISYSKVYFIQNSLENLEDVLEKVEYTRKKVGVREGVFKFRYVIDDSERDEFTEISITPNIKYLNYNYSEYVDFNTKAINSYYDDFNNIYLDRGTFLQNMTNYCVDVDFLNRKLKSKGFVKILKSWSNIDPKKLFFIEIDDEGMGKNDLFRDDIVLIEKFSNYESGDVVVILKDGHVYARTFLMYEDREVFVACESIFGEIINGRDVEILGRVVGYIRKY